MDTFWNPPGEILSLTPCTAQLRSHCHTSLLIPKLSSQLGSELFCSACEHQPQSSAGVNKGIHFFYIVTNVGIKIQTEGRADWGSMAQNHRMKSYPPQWQLDFYCTFYTEKNIWKPCYSLTRTSPSVCCSAERAQDTLTLLSFSSLVWPRPEQGDHRKILDSWKDAPTWTRSWAAANTPRTTKCNSSLWKQRLRGDLMHVWAYTQQPEELLSLIR